MAKTWAKFPHADKKFQHTPATLKKSWDRLHRGDAEPFPKNDAVIDAWIAFHAGDFQTAAELGAKAGADGVNVANKAVTRRAFRSSRHSRKASAARSRLRSKRRSNWPQSMPMRTPH